MEEGEVMGKRMHEGSVWPLEEADYEKLDPGVRKLVRFLVANGYHTTDSGDGVSKKEDFEEEMLDIPHVFMSVDPDLSAFNQAGDLVDLLESKGVKMEQGMVEMLYDPVDDSCIISLVNVTDADLEG